MKRKKRLPRQLRQQVIVAAGRVYVHRARLAIADATLLVNEMRQQLRRTGKRADRGKK